MNSMHRCVILLVIFLSVMVVVSSPLSAQFAGGDGTEESPFLVENADQLDYVRGYPEAYFRQIDHIDLINYTGGDGWEPISNFSGGYFGNGYSITNLVINLPNDDYVGLFGYVEEALISGIKIIDAHVTGRENTGILIGGALDSNIYLSYSTGTVSGNSNAGGLIGYLDHGTVVESFSAADVSGEQNVGGLVGGMNDVTIENCYSLGEIDGEQNIGGLIGVYSSSCEVINCYSAGKVSGVVNVGGLIGEGNGSVTNSYWDEESSGISSSAGGESRKTSEMTYPYSVNTFVNWDFVYRWLEDDDNDNDGYPYLISNLGENIRQPFDGSGTEVDPFLIYDSDQLIQIRGYMTSHFRQESDLNLEDIPNYSQTGWIPIGLIASGNMQLPSIEFTGSYDGNDYIIYNLSVNLPYTMDYIGLFSSIRSSLICNTNINTANISGNDFVGCLAGKSRDSKFINCSVVNMSVDGSDYVGGITGELSFHDYDSTGELHPFTDNSATNGFVAGRDFVGGVIGYTYDFTGYSGLLLNYANSNCQVNGEVFVGGLVGSSAGVDISNSFALDNVTGITDVGGLVGYIISSVFSSAAYGNISGTENVGGLIGRGSKGIFDSYAVGEVNALGDATGGLVGLHNEVGNISNCYSTGNVTSYGNRVGGLIGKAFFSASLINSCFSTGDVSGINKVGGLVGKNSDGVRIESSFANGNVTGYDFVGGLIGYNDTLYDEYNPDASDTPAYCYATGRVEGHNNVGGLIGYVNGGDFVLNSNLFHLYSTGDVQGLSYVGGIIGYNDGADISKVYSIGNVTYEPPGNYIGGLIGRNTGSVTDSYWDIVTSSQKNSDNKKGKLTVKMLESPTMYDNWDFTGNWAMTDFTTYPYLWWQGEPGIHNYPPNGYYKLFAGREFYWESFPVLWDRDIDGNQDGREVLDPLAYHYYISVENEDDESMLWNGYIWSGDDIVFNSTRGYQISFDTEDELDRKS